VRALQEKEEELRRRARRLAESKTENNEAERSKLKKESDRLKDLLNQLSSQFGAGGSMRGGPPGFAAGINAHKIYFCIKDRADEMADLKRQRLDSLTELTGSAQKRARTKSEAIRDISSSAIHEFVA
jgi:DNA repair exonuclease SbcCD ATPase subunit|tara:strand:- start:857 stop:1237 length:381 start_codon:yes stop_codon:yes gene_type:complete